ncbi:PREDICTED: pectinesterase inhibitor 1-like [Tarenaya hassleriana]|uniref:pectinesterase inhibitor 1-like n=1 Tax=Tarenaya hassleriana TaxID=28532 RepID=UPI00053C744C|nr:PREDICTED: pectinesterase inhibitor 1-like [Tarenaya hassleriana]
MAASYSTNNAFLSSLMFLLLIGSSYAITAADINAICGKTLNPSFCLKFLKSNPKILAAGLPAVAKITIDSAQTSASKTFKRIQSIVQKTTDPKSKQAYTSCLDNYESVVDTLDEAKEHLAAGDPVSVNVKVSAAMDGPDSCLDDLKNVKADPSVVKSSEYIGSVCGITLVIANMLPRRM